jgi:hypothetical protein
MMAPSTSLGEIPSAGSSRRMGRGGSVKRQFFEINYLTGLVIELAESVRFCDHPI